MLPLHVMQYLRRSGPTHAAFAKTIDSGMNPRVALDYLMERGIILESPFKEGKNYFIRAIPFYYVGELKSVDAMFIVMTKCSWIPDTGRFSQALRTGQFTQVQPYPRDHEVIISLNCFADASPWHHKLPEAPIGE